MTTGFSRPEKAEIADWDDEDWEVRLQKKIGQGENKDGTGRNRCIH